MRRIFQDDRSDAGDRGGVGYHIGGPGLGPQSRLFPVRRIGPWGL
jgi:hypothetical protein